MENTMIYENAYSITEANCNSRKHHWHVVNRLRFTVFMVTVLLVFGMTVGLIAGSFDAEGSSRTTYETITVQYGDTLWDIAENYKPADRDIRDYIYEICDKNDISSGEIYQGQNLVIPVSE